MNLYKRNFCCSVLKAERFSDNFYGANFYQERCVASTDIITRDAVLRLRNTQLRAVGIQKICVPTARNYGFCLFAGLRPALPYRSRLRRFKLH